MFTGRVKNTCTHECIYTHEMLCSGIKSVPRSWVWRITPVIPILLKAEAGRLKTILDYRSPCLKNKSKHIARKSKRTKSTLEMLPLGSCHLVTQLPCNPETGLPSPSLKLFFHKSQNKAGVVCLVCCKEKLLKSNLTL